MRRLWVKLGIGLMTVGTLGGLTTPGVAQAKSHVIYQKSDLQRYYRNAKSKTAFHFETITTGKKSQVYIVLGDFGSHTGVRYGVPTTKFTFSKNGRTLTTKYKLVNFRQVNQKVKTSLTKQTYTFKLTKQSATRFTIKLANPQARHFDTKGTTYTYTMTKSNPAKTYANKYAKPILLKKAQATVAKETKWSAAQKKSYANKLAQNDVNTLIKNFNFKF